MKYLFFCYGILLSLSAFSQEQLGLRLENYAGTSGLSLNPTSNLNNPLRWDLNLAGAGFFIENNFGFVSQTNAIVLLKNRDGATFILAADAVGGETEGTYVVDFFDDGRKRFLNMGMYLDGPSLAVRIGDFHSVGVFTRLRSHAGSQNLPNELSYYKYDGKALGDPLNIRPFDGAFMAWSEVGVNYALKIPTYSGSFSLGVSLKRLQGYEAGYVQNFSSWDYLKQDSSQATLVSPDGRFGFTDSNLTENGMEVVRNGTGFSFDLGASLTIEEYEDEYTWRFGAAILDIGAIKFTENAQAHRIDTKTSFTLDAGDYEKYQSIEEVDDIIRQFSQQALGSPSASFRTNTFSLTLPTALSLQADRRLTENVFLNATLVKGVSFGGLGVRRGDLLAFTPRFEHRWFSASLPVALYNWQALRMGFAARLGYLVIGSDDLGSFVGKGDLTGTDIYFALKFNPFALNLNLFGNGGGSHRRYGKKGKVKCYDF